MKRVVSISPAETTMLRAQMMTTCTAGIPTRTDSSYCWRVWTCERFVPSRMAKWAVYYKALVPVRTYLSTGRNNTNCWPQQYQLLVPRTQCYKWTKPDTLQFKWKNNHSRAIPLAAKYALLFWFSDWKCTQCDAFLWNASQNDRVFFWKWL